MASEGTSLVALRKKPNTHDRIVAGSGKANMFGRKTESANGFAMCGPRGDVVHVKLEILNDPRLACGHDPGASMLKGECADRGIVGL